MTMTELAMPELAAMAAKAMSGIPENFSLSWRPGLTAFDPFAPGPPYPEPFRKAFKPYYIINEVKRTFSSPVFWWPANVKMRVEHVTVTPDQGMAFEMPLFVVEGQGDGKGKTLIIDPVSDMTYDSPEKWEKRNRLPAGKVTFRKDLGKDAKPGSPPEWVT
jgi:hypothetical protein